MSDPVRTRRPRLFWAFAIFFAAVGFGTAAWFLVVANQPMQTKLLGATLFTWVGIWLIGRSWWRFMR
jgi:hypothetical protein